MKKLRVAAPQLGPTPKTQEAKSDDGLMTDLIIVSDCVYMWERTVMVHTAETETATTPYYYKVIQP